jgi:hypothetical protein
MVAPIFKFRNVKVRLTDTSPTFVYGVSTYVEALADRTLDLGTVPSEVSTVVLTVQISNITGYSIPSPTPPSAATALVNAFVHNSTASPPSFDLNQSRTLVYNYPLITNNAFDPLSGNLVLGANDQLWIQVDQALACDVVVSLLEIANATAS